MERLHQDIHAALVITNLSKFIIRSHLRAWSLSSIVPEAGFNPRSSICLSLSLISRRSSHFWLVS
jgi:hypothetical protein